MKPTGITLLILFCLTLLAALTAYIPGLTLIWKVLAALSSGLLLTDWYLGLKTPGFEIRRSMKKSLSIGVWTSVDLEIKNNENRQFQIRVHDHTPPGSDCDFLPMKTELPSKRMIKLTYRFRPNKRGDCLFPGLDLIITSPLTLWRNHRFINLAHQSKVFPNFKEIKTFSLLATDNRLSQIGIRRRQRLGEGNDFHQLREYRAGDTIRQIDWKSTSRYQKLISREYQDERDQQVVFLLDCGRRMHHAENDRSHLDQALNAMLLLSYVASRQEDAIGFMAFGGVRKWFPPKKGGGVIRELLSQVYDLHSTTEAADYMMAARELLTLQKRRSLVVILTNTRDEDHEDVAGAIRLLKKRHLVVLADLREEILDDVKKKQVQDLDSAIRFQSVLNYLSQREKNHKRLNHYGVLTLDILAHQLPAALVNKYLMIKASGRL